MCNDCSPSKTDIDHTQRSPSMTMSDKDIARIKRNVSKWRDNSEGEIIKEECLNLINRLETAEQQVKALQEEKEVFVDLLSKKYDVMSWVMEDGWIHLQKQDTSYVEVKIDPSTPPIVSPKNDSSRMVQDQRCLLVPAKHLETAERELEEARAVIDQLAEALKAVSIYVRCPDPTALAYESYKKCCAKVDAALAAKAGGA